MSSSGGFALRGDNVMLGAAAPCSLFNPADLTSPLWDVGDHQISLPRGPWKPIPAHKGAIQSIKMLALSLARPVHVTLLESIILFLT